MAQITFKIDHSKFDKAFLEYQRTTRRTVPEAVAKQAHNLTLDLFAQFKIVAPTKKLIQSLPETLNYHIKLTKVRMSDIPYVKGQNRRHRAIAIEIQRRARGVLFMASQWLLFYNKKLKAGDKLYPRKLKWSEAEVGLESQKPYITLRSRVPGVEKFQYIVQKALDERARELTEHLRNTHRISLDKLAA